MIFSWTGYEPLTKGDYVYPPYANGLGWLIAMIAIFSVPIVAVFQIIHKMFVEHKDIGNIGEVMKINKSNTLNITGVKNEIHTFSHFNKLIIIYLEIQ